MPENDTDCLCDLERGGIPGAHPWCPVHNPLTKEQEDQLEKGYDLHGTYEKDIP